MNKRRWLLGAFIGCTPLAWGREKPNFLLIITDDQTFESVGCLNSREVKTPNIDRLVRSGTTFTHAFNQGSWTGAVSVASRTMLITGQHVVNAQYNSSYIVNWARTVPPEESTRVKLLGEVMQEAGYETFITGKWHNTDEPLLKSFQVGDAVAEGFYETLDEEENKEFAYGRPNGSSWTPWNEKLKGHWSPRVRDILPTREGPTVGSRYTVEQHTSELFADRAIRYINREHGSPFFMYVSFNAPHDPRQSPKKYVDMYPEEEIVIPPNYLPDHPFKIGIDGERDELLAPYPRTPEAVRLHRREYYAIISHFDHELGRILDALEASGQAENTVIIFTSDHGLAVGMHGLMGKQNLYDHSMRIPLIFAGPGIRAGRQIDALVYMQSIFATTCDLAGIPVPESVDYTSLAPLLRGKKGGEQYIFGSFRNIHRMVRSDRYKLILYPQARQAQLFDLRKDPYETANLIHSPAHRKVAASLFQALLKEQERFGDQVELELYQ